VRYVVRIVCTLQILAAILVVLTIAYETWHPCGMRAITIDTSQWLADGCTVEWTPADVWSNLFHREPRS
jgi:hypothetical protein